MHLVPFGAAAAELKVLSPGATESSLSLILPQFESSSEHKVKIEYGPVGQLANRVKTGEAVDVVILSEPVANGLRKEGAVVAGTETEIAKVGVGVFVRKGAPKPDISSVPAFLRAITNAKLIAYADPKLGGSASIYVGDLMESLDITGSIGPKTKLVPPAKPLLDLIATGGAEFGFGPISEILPDLAARSRWAVAAAAPELHEVHRQRRHEQQASGRRQGADCLSRIAARNRRVQDEGVRTVAASRGAKHRHD